ncbi:FUSC family protein [Burkholderia cenocepacia]|uniref:FUSC family protein n=1 Tax=Burkholderia cenocepacia TaxID=95486 RepID=UPI000AE4F419|nr:FUSC family protein [Burkholderia cenocepacia]
MFYSLRLYISAMLALGIAFWQDFPFPYWSMTIVYVLIQPSTDQTRLKSGHLFVGAVVGAIAGVASAAVFTTSPEVQLAALTLFMMLMTVCTLRDRRPRYYAYMMTGVTCLLVAMPGIATPDVAFDRAVGRIQDAMLAIFAFAVIDAFFFPRQQTSSAMLLVDQWLESLRTATVSALRVQTIGPNVRLSIVQRAIQLVPVADGMSRGGEFWHYQTLVAIIERGTRLLPILSAMIDLHRSPWLRNIPGGNRELDEALAAWIESGCKDDNQTVELRQKLHARPAWIAPYTLDAAIEQCRLRYLRAIYTGWRRIQYDRQLGETNSDRFARRRSSGRPIPATIGQVDMNFTVRGALSIGAYALLIGALWNATGWDTSAMAFATLMGISFCVTSSMADDPPLALIGPAKVAGIAMATVGFYLQVVFPSISSFPTLALALFPALFLLGLVVQQQGGVLFAILPMALLRLGNGQAGTTIDTLLNSIIGLYIGIGFALIAKMSIHRTPFVDVARRLMHGHRKQLKELTRASPAVTLRRFLLDGMDRFALLETRAAKLTAAVQVPHPGSQILREIQIGRSIHALRRWASTLQGRQLVTLTSVEQALSASLKRGTDPLQPWANVRLHEQTETQLRGLLASQTCNVALVRSLLELYVALGEQIPHSTQEPSRA